MAKPFQNLSREAGIVLLEGLIAIVIFALGILAIVGMQAAAVKQSTDARYRSEASLLADKMIGMMWASDRTPASLKANFATDGPVYTAWKDNQVATTLPGVEANPPDVNVNDDGTVTITIQWLAPSEKAGTLPHKHVAIAQIRPNS
ncbi:type IV pilus modification PilV family protein [Noviherbaspirillum massiliense]|uniref:type IV pilus modification PilV family protein n=1 Tax=Noviherbaspirillum massiliense TaxID=1465823 RepID=UPI0003102364|nr:hypothetical protein [Noviherbaspirillum massiliense]